MAKYLTSVYVSGWQCSSTASTSNEPGPDVADYPYDTVPNKVARVQDSWGFGFPGRNGEVNGRRFALILEAI